MDQRKKRINIGEEAFPRWRKLKAERGLRTDTEVVPSLLDWYVISVSLACLVSLVEHKDVKPYYFSFSSISIGQMFYRYRYCALFARYERKDDHPLSGSKHC